VTIEEIIEAVRQVQHATRVLSFNEFCEALGCERGKAHDRFKHFQALGALEEFDDGTLHTLLDAYVHKITKHRTSTESGTRFTD
jgi:hypothetical protein